MHVDCPDFHYLPDVSMQDSSFFLSNRSTVFRLASVLSQENPQQDLYIIWSEGWFKLIIFFLTGADSFSTGTSILDYFLD